MELDNDIFLNDLMINIFMKLRPVDICNLSFVNKKFGSYFGLGFKEEYLKFHLGYKFVPMSGYNVAINEDKNSNENLSKFDNSKNIMLLKNYISRIKNTYQDLSSAFHYKLVRYAPMSLDFKGFIDGDTGSVDFTFLQKETPIYINIRFQGYVIEGGPFGIVSHRSTITYSGFSTFNISHLIDYSISSITEPRVEPESVIDNNRLLFDLVILIYQVLVQANIGKYISPTASGLKMMNV